MVLGKDGGALGMILASDSFYLYGCYFDKIDIINLGNPCGKIYSGLRFPLNDGKETIKLFK